MKLSCVLTSCTINQPYYGCLPLFIRAWRTLYPQVKIKVVFVHETVPEELEPYRGHIIHFPPVEGLPVSFQSLYIRLLYPALLGEEGVMVSDVDRVPMNRRYFCDKIRGYDDKFISYHKAKPHSITCLFPFADDGVTRLHKPKRERRVIPQIPFNYNVASSEIWGEVFDVRAREDIPERLFDAWRRHRGIKYCGTAEGWYIDQIDLSRMVEAWDSKTHRHICLSHKPWDSLHLNLNLYIKHIRPKHIKPEPGTAPESNRFVLSLFLLCAKWHLFCDYQMVRHHYSEDYQRINQKIIEHVPARPASRLVIWVSPLLFCAYRGVMTVCRTAKKVVRSPLR